MIKPLSQQNENERLSLLKSFCIFDTKPEEDFENITAIAAQICGTPIALISLLDENRQWFKSHHGLNVSETPKDYSFCAHAINHPEGLLIVEDARKDLRFYDNPLVVGEPSIVFYAGVVLKNSENLPFGTLCVIDQKVHRISNNQIKLLKALAVQVVYLMENRKNKILLDNTLQKLKTKTKQARIKENELKIIHQNIPITLFQFIIKKDKTNYFTYLSSTFKKTFPIELPLKDVDWLKHIRFYPDDYEVLFDKLKKLDPSIQEFNFVGRFLVNEEIIWFEVNSSVTVKKGIIVLDGTIKNITTAKNIEDNLRIKTIFNDLVLSNIPADIALFDKDHNYLFVNQNGIKNDELRKWLIGKNDFDYCNFKQLDTAKAQERRNYFNKAIQTKNQVDWIDEINKEGVKTYIFRRFYPFYIDNVFVYMIGYGIDVTELKKTKNELKIQNEILVNKNMELERFAYIASHDLQEPLLSLIGYSNLLEDDYYEKLDDDGKLYLTFIKKSATRMRNLITALMEFSRIEKKEAVTLVDLKTLFVEVKEDLTSRINEYHAVVTWGDLPKLYCYPTFMRLLVQNLISNAIKFTHKSTIPEVNVSVVEREDDWLFKVKDNGVGIDPKDFGAIFQIFKRLHNEQDYAGNGVGLAVCKKIVEIHGGSIWVESFEKNGCAFNFTIAKNIQYA